MNGAWHIAQFNVARGLAPLASPQLAEFIAAIDAVNATADAAPGFVWRLQDEHGDATNIRMSDDDRLLVNVSVWESIEALFDFTYRSAHNPMMVRRLEWFERPSEPYLALWWIPAGHVPDLEEAAERLAHLREHGPSERAFTLKQRFEPPSTAAEAAGG